MVDDYQRHLLKEKLKDKVRAIIFLLGFIACNIVVIVLVGLVVIQVVSGIAIAFGLLAVKICYEDIVEIKNCLNEK